MTALNPWQWYVSTRTFSNSLETTLTIAALNFWPWHLLQPAPIKENPKAPSAALRGSINRYAFSPTAFSALETRPNSPPSLRLSLLLAAIAVLLRPTNLLIWLPVLLLTLRPTLVSAPTNPSPSTILVLLREVILCGLLALSLSLASDRLYFGFWAFPPYKWLHFNISQSLAVFYGRNPWHYYFLQGLPLLCTTLLPFVLAALYRPADGGATPALRALPWAVYTTIGALSLISHKEVRFTYPLLPILHVLAAPRVARFFVDAPTRTLKNKGYLAAGLAANLLLASYLSLAHQGAPLAVLSFLRSEFARLAPTAAAAPFVMFLTPCHSTPWRSHLVHPGLAARALTCEPPLDTLPGSPERELYRDEADRFYDDPQRFLATELWPAGEPVPRLIVGFEGVEPWLEEFFRGQPERGVDVKRVWEGWNGFFTDDSRRAGRLVVWDTGVRGI